jgi:hypothetical protein
MVIDLVNNIVLVHENPNGDAYSTTTALKAGDVVHISANASDSVEIAAATILP